MIWLNEQLISDAGYASSNGLLSLSALVASLDADGGEGAVMIIVILWSKIEWWPEKMPVAATILLICVG